MRLELLHHLMAIVDEREPCALASSVLCSEPEAGYLVFVCFVELRELLAEFVFTDVCAVGVEDVSAASEAPSAYFRLRTFPRYRLLGNLGRVHDHLLSTEEGIADEFACAQRYGLLSVGHLCGLEDTVSTGACLEMRGLFH